MAKDRRCSASWRTNGAGESAGSEGKPWDHPNIVMGADVHTVWEKFARYFDVELKLIPLQEDTSIVSADEVVCVQQVLRTYQQSFSYAIFINPVGFQYRSRYTLIYRVENECKYI